LQCFSRVENRFCNDKAESVGRNTSQTVNLISAIRGSAFCGVLGYKNFEWC
jgi:hypothetical protein